MVDFTKPVGLDKIWASNGAKTPAPDAVKIATGWVVEIPPKETFNYVDNKQDAFIAHINQYGIPLWDINTFYQANKSYAMGSNGIIYRAQGDSGPPGAAVNPVGDVTGKWLVAFYLTTEVYTKSETDGRYLIKASNLSDLANVATARTNISVYSKSETDAKYPTIANNLSDITASTARTNLSVYSKSETDIKYPTIVNNLSDMNAATVRTNLSISSTSEANTLYAAKTANLGDLPSPSTARTNLDVYNKSETDTKYLIKANNLSDVVPATARTNLGISSTAEANALYTAKAANLSDVVSVPTARSNLDVYSKGEADGKYLPFTGNLSGLSNPATSFNNIKQAATDSYAGVSQFSTDAEVYNGVVADKGIAPSKLKLGFAASLGINGYIQLPSWLLAVRFEWGRINVNSSAPQNVTMTFPNNCFVFIPSLAESPDQSAIAIGGFITSKTLATISYFHGGSADTAPFMWFAIGN